MGSKKLPRFGKKKKNSSKKEKSAEGGHVGESLAHSTFKSAAPVAHRSDVIDPQNTTGILTSTNLGRMFTEDDLFTAEETDTSLYDYDHAKQTMPSTFGTGDFGTGLGVPVGFRNEDLSDGTMSPDFGPSSHEVEAEINPAYASVQRNIPKPMRSASPATLRHSGSYMPETGTFPRGSLEGGAAPLRSSLRSSGGSDGASAALGSPGGSGRRRRSAQRSPSGGSMEERIEAQIVGGARSSVHSSLDRTLTRVSTDLSASGSVKMTTLREQNSALVDKQANLERQLTVQRHLQEQVMTKLKEQGMLLTGETDVSTQELGSLLQETHSATDKTLSKHQQLIGAQKERLSVADQEKRELEEMNEQLRMEIMSVHRLASAREDEKDGSQVQWLKEDRDTLKTMTIKLNSELSRYQNKYGRLSQAELEQIPGLPLTGPKPSWLVDTKRLAPLIVAYEEQLQEKDATLREVEKEFDSIQKHMEEVVRENSRLHIRLEQSDITGPIGMTDWQTLQEQCKLVLEENQLLMEQLELQQSKVKDLHKAHIHEVTKMSKRLVVAEAERSQLEEEVSEIRDKVAAIKRQRDEAVIDSKVKFDSQEHTSALADMRKILEEEKSKHNHEIDNILTKMQNLATERKTYSLQTEELQIENQTMQADLKAMQKAQKKAQKKIQHLQAALQESDVKEQTAERYLSNIIRVAEKTAKERDSFVEVAETEQRQKKEAINRIIESTAIKSQMEDKLKLVKCKAADRLEKAVSRLKEQDSDFQSQKQEYEREIKHLRLLLRERQELLESTAGDKKRVEDDLETMWQVTTAENQRMKDTVKKSLRKMQEHGSLRNTDSDAPLRLCDSDVEK